MVYQVNCRIEGTAPLLQNKIIEMNESPKKRSEEKDNAELATEKRYIVDGKIVQPAICIERAMVQASSSIKMQGSGKKTYKELFMGSVFVRPEFIEHQNQNWKVHKCTVVIPATKGRINRYRPVLDRWALNFVIEILDDRIKSDVLKLILDEAGRTKGIGDWRPRYGRFIVTKFEIEK